VPRDTAYRSADTVFVEPIGARLTIPSFWMGRTPTDRTSFFPGGSRFQCQAMEAGAIEDRLVTDKLRLSSMPRPPYGPQKEYEAAFDSLVPRSLLAAQVGPVPYSRNCVAPHVRIYVADTTGLRLSSFGSIAVRQIEREYSGVRSASVDSAGWSIVRITWTESKTDFIHPASLEFWSRRIGHRMLILAVMDTWAGKDDVGALLNSVR
jgi:hypothetical protein